MQKFYTLTIHARLDEKYTYAYNCGTVFSDKETADKFAEEIRKRDDTIHVKVSQVTFLEPAPF